MEYYLAMKMSRHGEFPGGPGVRILGFHCCGQASVPGQGTESQAENKQTGRSGALTLPSMWMNLDNTEASHGRP